MPLSSARPDGIIRIAERRRLMLDRVGAEHLGLARLFCGAARTADSQTEAVFQRITTPLRERLRAHRSPRPELPIQAELSYRFDVPPAFRLRPLMIKRSRRERTWVAD